jgi:hypothetical protein
MTSYLQDIEEKSFVDLVDNYDFKVDLVKFFSGGRYKMSREEMQEQGYENLAKKFAEHMRFQSWNDATAVKDLNYVNNKQFSSEGKESFGNLIQAWDNSAEAGTGVGVAAADFGEALLKSPSTYLGMGSFGLAKAGAKAATKSAQISVRNRIKDYFTKSAMLKGAATGAATEGAVGAVTAGSAGEVRDELLDINYTTGDLAKDTLMSAAFGSVGGAAGAYLTKRKGINVDELLAAQKKLNKANAKKASEVANQKISSASKESKQFAINTVLDLEATLAARKGDKQAGVIREPLDPKRVSMGEALLRSFSNTDANDVLSSGLDLTTLRSITAATIELSERLDLKPNQRITSAVAGAIDEGVVDVRKIIPDIRDKYNLSKEQFSLIYLADLSNAGKKLAEASKISRAVDKQVTDRAMNNLKAIAETKLSTISDIQAAELAENVVNNSAGKGASKFVLDFFRNLDQMRIAFMTSQPATTARNVTSTGLLAGTEIVDEFYRGMARGIMTTARGEFDYKPGDVLMRMTSTLRGLSFDSVSAKVAREMLEEEMPEAYARTFHDTLRTEVSGQSQSRLAKVGRAVNIVNTATDTVFKEAAFFSSLDKQLRTLNDKSIGTNVKDFILTTGSLDKLDEGIVAKALDDANRFTMQRTYVNDDSLFGKGARIASTTSKRIPFLFSGVLGVPFPRYVANHIEMIADYTPGIGALTAALDGKAVSSKGFFTYTGDPYKSQEDRLVRQFTGASLIFAGYHLAASKEGEIDYESLETAIKGETDIASSLGFIIAPVFIGDLLYRKHQGLALPDSMINESLAVAGGLNDMGFDLSGIREVIDSFAEGGLTEGFQKGSGNILSTFTYPLTPLRDIQGQFNYESAGSPYVRSLPKGIQPTSQEEASGIFAMQATRFLPDYESVQYTQSFMGEPNKDIDLYSIVNPMPVGKMNPLNKTFTGLADSPPITDLKRELNKLNIKEYDIYKNHRIPNTSLDYVVRFKLAKNLSKNFNAFRNSYVYPDGINAGLTYDEIENVDRKKEALKGFIDQEIESYKKQTQDFFTDLVNNQRVKARGFIRNNYFLKRSELGEDYFNEAANLASKGKFKTSLEYLQDSENIEDELGRRQVLINIAGNLKFKLPTFDR